MDDDDLWTSPAAEDDDRPTPPSTGGRGKRSPKAAKLAKASKATTPSEAEAEPAAADPAPEVDDEVDPTADAADPADGQAVAAPPPPSDDGWDDDDVVWDEGNRSTEPRFHPLQLALVLAVLLVVAIVLVVKSGDDGGGDDEKSSKPTPLSPGVVVDGTTAPPNATTAPPKPEWPRGLFGRPAGLGARGQAAGDVEPAVDPGVYLWNDFDGWHLWVVGGDVLDGVKGSLTSSDELGKADVAVEGGGDVTLTGQVATFDLDTDEPITGVDFNPGFFGDQLTLVLTDADDAPLDPALFHIGSQAEAAPLPYLVAKAPQG